MNNDKFVFEWREGDKCIYNGAKWHVDSEWLCDDCWIISYGETLQEVCGHEIKPSGKTKTRYKAEKLAWKQARIKVGDWFYKEVDCGVWGGEPFEVVDVLCHAPFTNLRSHTKYIVDKNGTRHYSQNVKPCKPPKPEKELGPEFRLEDGWVAGKYSEKIFQYGSDGWAVFENAYADYPNREYTKNFVSPEGLRQIADLLEVQARENR